MPTFAVEEKVAPKSLLRHRPIGETSNQTRVGRSTARKSGTNVTAAIEVAKPRASRTREDIAEWKYTPVSEKTAAAPGPQAKVKGRTAQVNPVGHAKKALPQRHLLQRVHPLFYLGGGMVVMLVLWMGFSMLSGWFTTAWDDLQYGRPRTFQMDVRVGHNEQSGIASHFIALNLNGRIEIIEFPGGDASHARVYIGPQLYGPNADLAPVTLTFFDVNGDHKLDMIVNFQGSHIVYINDQGGFRPALPSEQPEIDAALHHLGQ